MASTTKLKRSARLERDKYISIDATCLPNCSIDDLARIRHFFDIHSKQNRVCLFVRRIVKRECDRRESDLKEPMMVAIPLDSWSAEDLCEFVRMVRLLSRNRRISKAVLNFARQATDIGFSCMAGRLQCAEGLLFRGCN
jgi:hypothetical protein